MRTVRPKPNLIRMRVDGSAANGTELELNRYRAKFPVLGDADPFNLT